MTTRHGVYSRNRMAVNTDPQRRCYNGCNFSERIEWGAWYLVCAYASKADAGESMATFQSINPEREYKLGTEVDIPEELLT